VSAPARGAEGATVTLEELQARLERVKSATRPSWLRARDWGDLVSRAEGDIRRMKRTQRLDDRRLAANLGTLEKELRYAAWAGARHLALVDRGTSNAWERALRCPREMCWGGRFNRLSAWDYLHNRVNWNARHRWVDHARFWNRARSGRPAAPACITTEPYGYDREQVERFARERGMTSVIRPPEESLYWPGGTHFIQLWAPALIRRSLDRDGRRMLS
jgi:hypothetical protein